MVVCIFPKAWIVVLWCFRREWDSYLIPSESDLGSLIPAGFVQPAPPSSAAWANTLTCKEKPGWQLHVQVRNGLSFDQCRDLQECVHRLALSSFHESILHGLVNVKCVINIKNHERVLSLIFLLRKFFFLRSWISSNYLLRFIMFERTSGSLFSFFLQGKNAGLVFLWPNKAWVFLFWDQQ